MTAPMTTGEREAAKDRLIPVVARTCAFGVEILARNNDPTGDRMDALLDEIIDTVLGV